MTQEVLTRGLPAATRSLAEEISARHDEPSWLRERRIAAWERYEAMDLPDPGEEEWRRTDVRAIDLGGITPYAPAPADASLPAFDVGDVAGRIELRDGELVRAALSDELAAQGVVVTDLHTAAREHAELLRQHLGSAVKDDEWKYLALNAALWRGGVFVSVPKGVVVRAPLHVMTSATASGTAVFPRTLIVVGREAELRIIDETASPDAASAGFVSGAVEIIAEDGAHVEYYSVNRWGHGVYNFNTVRALVGRDSSFLAMAAGIGSKLTKMRLDSIMPQSGARTELLGVTFGDGDQHFDYNTLQDHIGGHTTSDLQFKAALTDSASLVWYGVTRIQPTAGGSEANQTSRNLLLSEHAKAAPIPILEIAAYDVSKCSHGATAGPVDEEQLYYLQARAISRQVAEQMLVEGFFADVVDRVPDERLRGRIMDAVLAKIGGSAGALTFDEVLSA
jgi:Fe-S cluster assembly protein SufD